MSKLYRKQTKLWTTKDGRRLRICDMDNEHLVNTIKLLQRVAETKKIHSVVLMTTCVGPNGDMAQLAFDDAFDQTLESTFEDYLPPIYENFECEMHLRKLEMPIQQERIDIEVSLISKSFGRKVKSN